MSIVDSVIIEITAKIPSSQPAHIEPVFVVGAKSKLSFAKLPDIFSLRLRRESAYDS